MAGQHSLNYPPSFLFRYLERVVKSCIFTFHIISCSFQASLWLTASMLYFTLGLESSKLGGNMYQVFALSVLCEVPGCFASLFLCNRCGRKRTVLGCFLLCALFTGSIAAIPRYRFFHILKCMHIFLVTLAGAYATKLLYCFSL